MTVARSVTKLKEKGLLAVEGRENGKSNLYRLPEESGYRARPVAERGRSQSAAGTGHRARPEASAERGQNRENQIDNSAASAAEALGISPRTLEAMRSAGEVPHVRLGRRLIRYPVHLLKAWMTERAEGVSKEESEKVVDSSESAAYNADDENCA